MSENTRRVVYKGNVVPEDGTQEIRSVGVNENETLVANGAPVEVTEEQFVRLSRRFVLEEVSEEEAEELDAQQGEGDAVVEGSKESQEGSYDPGEHNADDVVAYLQTASDEERDRVIAAEREGKNRSTIVNYQPGE